MRLPIGIQDFPSLREENYIYVDKTIYLPALLEHGRFFLSRPRRFGKSLLLSTLKAVFDGRKDLFKGLWLHDHHDFKTRVVLRLDFSIINFRDKSLNDGIVEWLQILAKDFNVKISADNARDAFRDLILELSRNQKIVVLIDEYDKPITDVLLESDKRTEHQAILKGLYGVLKPLDEHLHMVFLTGVSKIGKLSLFSDLNNIQDISLNPRFANLLGYTREEIEVSFPKNIQEVAQTQGVHLEQLWNQIRFWYNGYSWDGKNSLYCPFSFLLFLENKEWKSYWFETATPTFLLHLIRAAQLNPLEFDGSELSNKAIVATDIDHLDPISLMFQTGYLTIAKKTLNTQSIIYQLKYPNEEVRQAFSSALIQEYAQLLPSKTDQLSLLLQRALIQLDWDTFFAAINRTLASVPYEIFPRQEIYIHSLVHIMLLSTGLRTQSQVQTSLGRMDTIVETPDHQIIIEYKIGGTPEEALHQIDTTQYASGFTKPVIQVGVVFDLAQKQISAWAVQPK
jgi:hypothetical protein